MIGWALFKNRDFYLRFMMSSGGSIEKTKYSLGGVLCDFTAVSPKISERLFQILNQKFITDVTNRIDKPTIGAYVPFLHKALETNPYLFIYLRFYAECLLACCENTDNIEAMLDEFLCTETMEAHREELILRVDIKDWAAWLCMVIYEDLEFRRLRAKKLVTEIVAPNEGMSRYTNAQRFYILRTERNSGLVTNFKSNISTLYDFERGASLGTVKTVLQDDATTLLQEFEINNPDDLITLELFFTVVADLPIKVCRCCGEYFVPTGRSDCEYCSRVNSENGHRCSGVGAMKSFKENHANDPIYTEYNKAYKRMHSKYRNAKLYDWEFKNWSKKARELRDRCKRESLSVEQYKLLLEEIEITAES